MNGIIMLYHDQYGNCEFAATVEELRKKVGGKGSKMYRDDRDGRTYHVGYVVGNRWFTAFQPVRREQGVNGGFIVKERE